MLFLIALSAEVWRESKRNHEANKMDASTATGKLIVALKLQLKAKHLSYRAVATQLKVSEATVKRYFSGKGVTIEVLQRLAEIVDLDLLSLAIVAQDQSVVQHGMSPAQLAVIKRKGPLGAVFFQLLAGWTVEQIVREFNIGSQIDGYLTKLEDLGMIRRLSKRGVKVLVKPSLGERAYGEMSDLAAERAQQFLRELNLREDKNDFHFDAIRLSQASVLELQKIMRHFENEIRELSRRDLVLRPEETQWYRVFVVAKILARKELFNWS
jgi:transcriptional regulator with XRE-family HTH domain